MHSIRPRFTLLNVIAISATIVVTTTIIGISIAMLGHSSSEKELSFTCEEGKSDLNYYFKSIEQSRIMFGEAAKNTNGVLTYYYRIDSDIDKTAEDAMIHADHLMYENKRNRKKKNT